MGSRGTGVVDGLATIVDGRHVVVYVWYDNEYGYSEQVLRVAETMAGVERPVLPLRRSASSDLPVQSTGEFETSR